MMERVWRKLPLELLEEVVTFLPLASLYRFRAVSKNWNRFIDHPNFASRHAQATSPEEYVLVSERDVGHQQCTPGWEVLDVASKRFFTLSDDFLAEFVKQEEIIEPYPQTNLWISKERSILAADGGLLCLSYYVYHKFKPFCKLGTHEALLVCNPLLKTVKQLPCFAGWSERPQWVVMSTNKDSTEYKIFFITLAEDTSQSNVVYIYESKTTSWTSAAVPGHLNALTGRLKPCSGYVVLMDEFYALLFHHDGLYARLISYNKVTGAFSDHGIDVPCHGDGDGNDQVSLQLVVSNDRLFCMTIHAEYVGCMMEVSSIEIVEFILARREYIHLSVLESKMLDWFLDPKVYFQDTFFKYGTPAVATGLANSIFVCSFEGRSVVYNLSNKTWHKYFDTDEGTGCNFEKRHKDSTHYMKLFGIRHCFSLCPP